MTLSAQDAAREHPSRIALVVGPREIPFRELGERVARTSRWLALQPEFQRETGATGLPPVALVGHGNLATLEVFYALLELGRPVALLHPRLTAAERATQAALVTRAGILDVGPRDVPVPRRHPLSISDPAEYAGDLSVAPAAPEQPPVGAAVPGRPDDPETTLAVLFTSGTTGAPKGVALSRRAFVASARASERNLGFREGDRWLLGLPLAHIGGLSVLTRCLLARRTVVVPEAVATGTRLTREELANSLASARVTLVSLVPTQLEWLLSAEAPDLAAAGAAAGHATGGRGVWTPPTCLRAVLLGGAAARPALLERARARGVPVLTTYGFTEACSQVATQAPDTAPTQAGDATVGAPVPGTEVRIVDGAIQVRGPTLLSAYVTHAGLVSPLTADGFFHTDDLGRLDDEGRLLVLGRRSDLIISGGENVFPAAVEAVIERCPGVAAACVFGVPDDTWGQIVAVAIVPVATALPGDRGAAPGPFSEAALEAFLRAELGRHLRPRRVALLPALALTPAGKLDRKETAREAAPFLRPLGGGAS